ncbi:hypothetical protein [Saccharopolyspora griseoalba]|uniref:Uncharacterized protein n=1 Tax=Saccharopolyspora griseoalba TaxID=1431848 RepID=A0ABW2LLE7_9PSEU
MSVIDHVRLAVRLRETQWLIDDVAHHTAAHRLEERELAETARALAELAELLEETRTALSHR